MLPWSIFSLNTSRYPRSTCSCGRVVHSSTCSYPRALAPVVECLTPAPVVTNEAPTPGDEGIAPALAVTYTAHDMIAFFSARPIVPLAAPAPVVTSAILPSVADFWRTVDRIIKETALDAFVGFQYSLFACSPKGEEEKAQTLSWTVYEMACCLCRDCRDRLLFVLLYVRALCMASHHPSFILR